MEMYRNPAILGNATTEIIDTDHGKAFRISGSGSTRINMKKTGGLLATNPEVYSEEDGTGFKLSIIRDNGWGKQITINTEKEVKLTRGWQEVSLSAGSMWYD